MRSPGAWLASICLVTMSLLVAVAVEMTTTIGRSVIPIALLAIAGAGAAVAICWRETRRLRRVVALADRLAAGELGVLVDGPADGLVGRLERSFNQTSIRLSETHDAATTDRLTQVSNRGTMLSDLFTEVVRAVRNDGCISGGFLHLDHFTENNDSYGHHVGDIVLRGVAEIFLANLRASDMVGRYGGEEFMLVLPETSPEDATDVADKIRLLVQRTDFDIGTDAPLRVTISIGIAGGRGKALRAEALVQSADQAMYAAKSLGRNQTYVFREPDDDSRVAGAPVSAAGRARALEIAAVARNAAEVALNDVVAPLAHYRGKPSSLIATISVVMAADLGLPEQEVERIRVASLLHDIGKVAIPEQILEKAGPLTDHEWSVVRQHPRIGQLIIDEAGGLRGAGKIILHHHERFGGHGYPHGLRGRAIPLGSRIVAVGDSYEATVSDRPYKSAISHEQALSELRRHASTQFDPDLVALFFARFADNPPVPDASLLTVRPAPLPTERRARRKASA